MRSRVPFLVLLSALVGCSGGDSTTRPAPDTIDGILVNHTDPTALVDAHLEALVARSSAAYAAMLEKPETARGATGFRYYIREDDAPLVPWVTSGFWDYEAETTILTNLSDPAFAGEELPVVTIDLRSSVMDTESVGEGVQLTVDVGGLFLVGPDTGWAVFTRLLVEMHPDENGFLRIREIVELSPGLRDEAPSIEELSLGAVKAKYRWLDVSEVAIDGIRVNHTDASPLVDAHFRSLAARSAGAYKALLEPDFRFYIRDDDADLFPWLSNPYWDYDDEVAIIANLTNPHFLGEEPPVESIIVDYTTLNEVQTPEGRIHTLNVVVQILVGPDTGWIATTRLEIGMCLDANAFWRIDLIHEFDRLLSGREDTSFGQIKAIYR